MEERRTEHRPRRRRDDAWALLLVGALAADALWLDTLARTDRTAVRSSPEHGATGRDRAEVGVPDPASASPRELRALPGIGETRAIAIADARWRLPPGHSKTLSDLPGIGPVTEQRVRALLDHAAADVLDTTGAADATGRSDAAGAPDARGRAGSPAAAGRSGACARAVDCSNPSHNAPLGNAPLPPNPRAPGARAANRPP